MPVYGAPVDVLTSTAKTPRGFPTPPKPGFWSRAQKNSALRKKWSDASVRAAWPPRTKSTETKRHMADFRRKMTPGENVQPVRPGRRSSLLRRNMLPDGAPADDLLTNSSFVHRCVPGDGGSSRRLMNLLFCVAVCPVAVLQSTTYTKVSREQTRDKKAAGANREKNGKHVF